MIATIILLVLIFINLGYTLAKHGEPRRENHNFWYSLISVIIIMILFYYAGLFDKF